MYVCVCVCIYIYIYIYIYICVCVCVYIYIYIYIYVCVCVYILSQFVFQFSVGRGGFDSLVRSRTPTVFLLFSLNRLYLSWGSFMARFGVLVRFSLVK
jgi:hypothetical protein